MLLLSLIPYLMEHGDTPLAELARTFDIDAEALRALIEFLGTAGVPGRPAPIRTRISSTSTGKRSKRMTSSG
ncbi:hypothetical protein [Leucobacter soli]|uniref:hypothetical protein n=1 Tax=Leucobacter soli TaxID=2812850 RepID=UPI00360CB801